MPISYKHKIYTTLGTPTDLSGDVVSATDSAGVPAKDYTVKGKSIVWNQLCDKSKYPATTTSSGVTFTNNGDGTITVNGTAGSTANGSITIAENLSVIQGHKYYATMSKPIEHNNFWLGLWASPAPQPFQKALVILDQNGQILTCVTSSDKLHVDITLYKTTSVNNATVKPQFFDLTEIFGAGNEPATPEEFRAMFPDDYYPYNAGELKSIIPEAVETKNQYGETKRVNIPTLKYFPGGMKSIDSVYDEINFLSQKAIKRIGVRAYQTGDENDANVMTDKINTVYILSTPVETTITPPLQALPTYKGFTSFSAPNSLTQNGPLSVTYYAEGGANPEKGWLTSYKRKLYMGRTIEWNQLLGRTNRARVTHNGVTVELQDDGSYVVNGTATDTAVIQLETSNFSTVTGHKYLVTGCPKNGSTQSFRMYDAWSGQYTDFGDGVIFVASVGKTTLNSISVTSGYTCTNLVFKPQMFDLTQMFGAGNEPATPEEFWSYFDHKLYPYNAGETQPLFKISRKSQWGALPKHYTARWDKVNAAMVRLNDAASFPTDITNFVHRGSVNPSYSNPFDNIYPWSGIKLCNISIDLYRNLVAGDSITKCVTAWEGDANFSYNDTNGVWRYRPEFWGKSWEDDTYRYFDVTDQNVHGSNYVHYPEAIVGRWHGRNETLTIGEAEKTCLIPSVGMPAKSIAMSTLHTYAKNWGATLDSIFSIDANDLLMIVEFATMNTQKAIGNGVTSMYRQSSDLIAEDATNSNVVKVLASAASAFCIPGAIFDIGTSNGGAQVGSYHVVSVQPNIGDAQYLDVTLNEAVTVTAANYWSVHGLVNVADEAIGSKSGYIGENGKCNAYYRGIVMYGNMWFYILGAYENKDDHHIWIANSDAEADNYDALDTTVHYDTGLVLPATNGYTKKLGLLSRSGLLSIPAFCVETGGNSSNPVGDYFYNEMLTYNTVLLRGGSTSNGLSAGAFYGAWDRVASHGDYRVAARPRLKNP